VLLIVLGAILDIYSHTILYKKCWIHPIFILNVVVHFPCLLLMHAKYMHELCSLLMHIPIYYDVIICYNYDLQWFMGIFLCIPLILVITLQNRKPLFCVFWRLRNLPELKLTWIFWALIFYHENLLEHKKSMRWANRDKQDQVVQVLGQATPPKLVWASKLWCHQSLSQDPQLDLKTTI
jgi:hypothetical protein